MSKINILRSAIMPVTDCKSSRTDKYVCEIMTVKIEIRKEFYI